MLAHKFAVCPLSAIAVRNHPTQKSEMLTQILFGELVEIMEERGKAWCLIRCLWDDAVGWVASNQIVALNLAELPLFQKEEGLSLELFQPITASDHFLPVPMGARFPGFDGIRFRFFQKDYNFTGQVIFPTKSIANRPLLVKIARRYLHAPFMWGGRSPLGIDAPGLVQMAFKLSGIRLPRTADQQVLQGQQIDFAEQASPGDVAFFENNTGRIVHTGIVLADNQILHAFGKVRVDVMDHFGIFDKDKKKYTHRLRVVKSFLPIQEKNLISMDTAPEISNNQIPLF
jgi:hypothetical protein